MHGQHITITANNANNKIENVYRAAGLGFFQKKTVSSRTAKKTGRNLLVVASSFFQKKLEETGRNVDCTLKVEVTMEICWNRVCFFSGRTLS